MPPCPSPLATPCNQIPDIPMDWIRTTPERERMRQNADKKDGVDTFEECTV